MIFINTLRTVYNNTNYILVETLAHVLLATDFRRLGRVSHVVADVFEVLPLGRLAGTGSLSASAIVVGETDTQAE